MGDCIMPREGVFTEVVTGGHIKTGDEVELLPPEKDRPFTADVITLSDKGAAGERVDKSGPRAVEEALTFLLPELGHGLGILRGIESECARK